MRISSNSAERGNAVVEFALVLPVLALLTIGIIDVGRYAYFSIAISNAARAGATYGSQTASTAVDNAGMIAAAQADVANVPGTIQTPVPSLVCYQWSTSSHSASSVSCDSTGNNGNIITYAQVQVNGSMRPLISYPFVPGRINVSSTAQMRVICPTCP